MTRTVHPIEARSYRLLREAVDTQGLPPCTRDVVERIVHTTADPSWLTDLVPDEAALEVSNGRASSPVSAPIKTPRTIRELELHKGNNQS